MVVTSRFVKIKLIVKLWLRGAERVWPPSAARGSAAVPNGEGVASGSATQKNIIDILFSVFRVSCGHQKGHQIVEKIQSRGC